MSFVIRIVDLNQTFQVCFEGFDTTRHMNSTLDLEGRRRYSLLEMEW